jgi:hypothetical protein
MLLKRKSPSGLRHSMPIPRTSWLQNCHNISECARTDPGRGPADRGELRPTAGPAAEGRLATDLVMGRGPACVVAKRPIRARASHPVGEEGPNRSGHPSLSRPPVRPFIVAPKLVAPPPRREQNNRRPARIRHGHSDDRTHQTLTQINSAYPPRPRRSASLADAARELSVNDATVTKIVPNGADRSHRFTPRAAMGVLSRSLQRHDCCLQVGERIGRCATPA